MIETAAAPQTGQGPLEWNSVGQLPRSNKALAQQTLSPPAKNPSVPSNRSGVDRRRFSYVQWETDAAHCDLNQRLFRQSSQPKIIDFLDALKLLAHKNPNLRILELGDGQDETTHLCLEALRSNYDERLYSTYTVATTSLDTAFNAKITSKGACNVDVVFLDVEQQPQNQFLRNEMYDLIIITNVRLPNKRSYILLITRAVFFRGKSEPDSLGRPSEVSYQSSRLSFLSAKFPRL